MIIDFLRTFIGQPPSSLNSGNFGEFLEYILGAGILICFSCCILKAVFGLIRVFNSK